MDILKLVIQIVYILVCIALTIIVLRQEGKVGGLSGALTGSSETYWAKNKGRSVEGTLAKATKYLAAAFIILSVVLNLKWW
ncbi:MAG: preprotein translocase subunit SecG [Herbinix sp.]|nr:preprotein translocase subunit SecG [Herbinix sp.]